jgi:hypothetical protein
VRLQADAIKERDCYEKQKADKIEKLTFDQTKKLVSAFLPHSTIGLGLRTPLRLRCQPCHFITMDTRCLGHFVSLDLIAFAL